jgi:hypothetical protein
MRKRKRVEMGRVENEGALVGWGSGNCSILEVDLRWSEALYEQVYILYSVIIASLLLTKYAFSHSVTNTGLPITRTEKPFEEQQLMVFSDDNRLTDAVLASSLHNAYVSSQDGLLSYACSPCDFVSSSKSRSCRALCDITWAKQHSPQQASTKQVLALFACFTQTKQTKQDLFKKGSSNKQTKQKQITCLVCLVCLFI